MYRNAVSSDPPFLFLPFHAVLTFRRHRSGVLFQEQCFDDGSPHGALDMLSHVASSGGVAPRLWCHVLVRARPFLRRKRHR